MRTQQLILNFDPFYIVQSVQKLHYSRLAPLLPTGIIEYQISGARYILKALGNHIFGVYEAI